MDCMLVLTSRGPQWVLYHIQKQGGKGRLINSIQEAEPPSLWEDPITYVMVTMPPSLPPWGTVWVCNSDKAPTDSYPNYCVDILDRCKGVLEVPLYRWLLTRYEHYPAALERLALKLQVLAVNNGSVLAMEDVLPLVPIVDNTPFLWAYQRALRKPQGLNLIYSSSNTDLWKTFMVDGGLMKHLKANLPQLVHSLLSMRAEVNKGVPIEDSAILWHLSTLPFTSSSI